MKSKKLTAGEQAKRVNEYIAYCKRNKQDKNDTGADGKIADVLCREYVVKRLYSTDVKARKASRKDCTFKGNDGKMHNIEFKTGCGALAYEYDLDVIEVEKLLPDVEYIAYNPEFCDNMPVEKQFFVMSRNDFFEMLMSYSDKMPHTWFKLNKSRRQVNIQTFTNSNKKYDYLLECLSDFPTLENFIKEAR